MTTAFGIKRTVSKAREVKESARESIAASTGACQPPPQVASPPSTIFCFFNCSAFNARVLKYHSMSFAALFRLPKEWFYICTERFPFLSFTFLIKRSCPSPSFWFQTHQKVFTFQTKKFFCEQKTNGASYHSKPPLAGGFF